MTAVALQRRSLDRWYAPALAAALAITGVLVGWRGVDLPAQLYRVAQFRAQGLTLWDTQWFGGHWSLDYSVAFPTAAGLLGVNVTVVASVILASLSFDRLVVGHFGKVARVGSLLFAVGTMEQVAIGQLSFLMGEALALGACWSASRHRKVVASLLCLATGLASPLAAAFLALVLVASWEPALLAVTVVPVLAQAIMFPGQGTFPYPFGDLSFELGAAIVVALLIPRTQPVVRRACWLYVAATIASFALRTPMGGNVGRLEECLAIPLAACALWPSRRWLLVVLAIPMVLWQWTPAWGAIVDHNANQPSTHRAFYQPLLGYLTSHGEPLGRVEVVPTEYHWEAAYVAPVVALARGWERQLDTRDNPIFYGGPLTADTYHQWLLDNGVRFVALADAPLDYAGTAEARLLRAGVPGLRVAWQSATWEVWSVEASPGILSGPGTLVALSGDHAVIDVARPGALLLRVHYTSRWAVVAGDACVDPATGRWTEVTASAPGVVRLDVHLTPAPRCSPSTRS